MIQPTIPACHRQLEVNTIPDCELASRNVVWLSVEDFSALFGSTRGAHHISVATRIYKVAIAEFLPSGTVGVSICQHAEIKNYIFQKKKAEHIIVSRFETRNLPELSHITITIKHLENFKKINPIYLDYQQLTALVKVGLNECPVRQGQSFCVTYDSYFFILVVQKFDIDPVGWTEEELQTSRGIAGLHTNYDFIFDAKDIEIIKNIVTEPLRSQTFHISLVPEDFATAPLPLPARANFQCLNELATRLFFGRTLPVGAKVRKAAFSGWQYEFVLSSVQTKSKELTNDRYQTSYKIHATAPTYLTWEENDLVVTDGTELTALFGQFAITACKNSQAEKGINIVFHQDFRAALLKTAMLFAETEKFYIEINDVSYEVTSNSFKSKNMVEIYHNTPCRILWKIGPGTIFDLKATSTSNTVVVDSRLQYNLKAIHIQVEVQAQEKMLLKESELLEIFKKNFANPQIQGASKSIVKGDVTIKLSLSAMVREDESCYSLTRNYLGAVTDSTTIVFTSVKPEILRIVRKQVPFDEHDFIKKLDEMGLAGLNAPVQEVLNHVMIGRGIFSKVARRRGITPIRGLLLEGPPGTGKTSLARVLAKVLGCQENMKFISGPEVLEKWIGSSEENMRGLFKEAEEDFKLMGDLSALHTIIIDEIDAILMARSNDPDSKVAVLEQFLSKIDGPQVLNNLLVIGTTNRKDRIDPAALRPGRLELHIKVGLPDVGSREKIFSVQLKMIEKTLALHDDVSVKELAQITERWSGADITGAVRRANDKSLDRLRKAMNEEKPRPTEDELQIHPEGVVCQRDLVEAIREITGGRKDASSGPPQGMYN